MVKPELRGGDWEEAGSAQLRGRLGGQALEADSRG